MNPLTLSLSKICQSDAPNASSTDESRSSPRGRKIHTSLRLYTSRAGKQRENSAVVAARRVGNLTEDQKYRRFRRPCKVKRAETLI
jgi:hypothetical protein